MSGLDLAAIHTALADQIRAGIDSSGFTVKAFPSTSDRPCIEVWPVSIGYLETFGAGGVAGVNLSIRVFLSGANAETEWLQAARLLSAGTGFGSSVTDAVMADKTLGGAVRVCVIRDGEWNPEDGSIDIPVEIKVNKIGASV